MWNRSKGADNRRRSTTRMIITMVITIATLIDNSEALVVIPISPTQTAHRRHGLLRVKQPPHGTTEASIIHPTVVLHDEGERGAGEASHHAATTSRPTGVRDLVQLLHDSVDPLWELVKFEAEMSAAQDEKVSGLCEQRVLAHDGIHTAAREYLATKLHTANVPMAKVKVLINNVVEEKPDIIQDLREDLLVSTMRDSSMPSLLAAFLFSKGYHAVTTYRISHCIYEQGRESLARYLQSLNSELFGADIHPACSIGRSLFLSRGSCVVIGETARLGDDVIIMQGVTLGGNGKERGDRHPKLGSGVLVAAGSTVLGNIAIGDGVIISAGSVVLRPLPEYTRCSGVPAKVISVLRQHRKNLEKVTTRGEAHYIEVFTVNERGSTAS